MIFPYVLAAFFFWIINFGTLGTQVMALFCFYFICCFIATILNKGYQLRSKIFNAWILLMLLFIPGFIVGISNQNLGLTEMLLFFFVSVTLHFFPFTIGNLKWFDNIVTIVIASLALNFIFHTLFLLDLYIGSNYLTNSAVFETLLESGFAYGFDPSFEIQVPNYSSLIFAAAYFNSLLMLRYMSGTLKTLQLSIILFVDVYIFLVGSRSIYLVAAFSILMPVIFRGRFFRSGSFIKSRIKFVRFLALIIFGLVVLYVLNTVFQGLSDSSETDIVRVDQSEYLISNIIESPIFGKGFGYVGDYVRSQNHPWAFELSYLVLTLWIGLPCAILFFIYLFVIYYNSICCLEKFEDSIKIYSAYVSSVGIFIASTFNPYLYNFSSLWVVFIPFWYMSWLSPTSNRLNANVEQLSSDISF